MNPVLILTIIEAALKLAPGLITELQLLFAKGEPTPADWDALKAKTQKSYDDYIREAKGQPPAATSFR